MELVIHFLNCIYPLSPALIDQLRNTLKTKAIDRKEYLLRAGQVCRNVYFIHKGLLRCYYDKDNHEVCSWFMAEGDVIISVESFFQQKSSYEAIQSLQDAVLYYIDYRDLQNIYRLYPEFNFVGRVLTE